jgi:hypothetical protein
MMKQSLGHNFFSIFGTYEVYVTNLRGTSVEIVKQVKNHPTLLYSTVQFSTAVHSDGTSSWLIQETS